MFKIPIVFIVFNRPDHTKKTFEKLKELRPSQLFVIADGPRKDHPTDKNKCLAVRSIIDEVNWPCQIYKNYEDFNIGTKKKISSGLDWVFQHVDQAIILEDDCLPCLDFFVFCEKLLAYYADDNRVWVISGNNFQDGNKRGEYSYFFSKYPHTWGWATWRRAWKHYNGNIPFWNKWKLTADWKQYTPNKIERSYWEKIFDRVYSGEDTYAWDYPWVANIWFHKGLTIIPNVNLVTNIGHDEEAGMTKSKKTKIANVPTKKLGTLTHPRIVKRNIYADIYDFNYSFEGRKLRFPINFLIKIKRVLIVFIKKSIYLLRI